MLFKFFSVSGLSNELLWIINELKEGVWCTNWLSYNIYIITTLK